MGYAKTLELSKSHIVSADALASNDTEKTTTNNAYTKLKEITRINDLYAIGSLRIDFEMHHDGAGGSFARLKRNGVFIGVVQTSIIGAYVNKSQDFDFTDLKNNDTFELWGYADTPGATCYVQKFKILGTATDFINTLV